MNGLFVLSHFWFYVDAIAKGNVNVFVGLGQIIVVIDGNNLFKFRQGFADERRAVTLAGEMCRKQSFVNVAVFFFF